MKISAKIVRAPRCIAFFALACACGLSSRAKAAPATSASGYVLFPAPGELYRGSPREVGEGAWWSKAKGAARQKALWFLELLSADCKKRDRWKERETEDPRHYRAILAKPGLAVAKDSGGDGTNVALSLIVDIKRARARGKDGKQPYEYSLGVGTGRMGVKIRTEF